MANRLSSVKSLLPVMRPASVPLWCKKRQEEENVTSTWWSLFMASSEQICGLWRSSCSQQHPQILNLSFFFSKFSLILKWQHFSPCFIQRSRSSRHNVILPSLDISLLTSPNNHPAAVAPLYWAPLNVPPDTCPPSALTLSRLVRIW